MTDLQEKLAVEAAIPPWSSLIQKHCDAIKSVIT
jgi:hypothetical protein